MSTFRTIFVFILSIYGVAKCQPDDSGDHNVIYAPEPGTVRPAGRDGLSVAIVHANTVSVPLECSKPPEMGTCTGDFTRVYFDWQTRTCEHFSYTGCGGNGNRFNSIKNCYRICHPFKHRVGFMRRRVLNGHRQEQFRARWLRRRQQQLGYTYQPSHYQQYPHQPIHDRDYYHTNPYQQYQSQYGSTYPDQQNSSYPDILPQFYSGYAQSQPPPTPNPYHQYPHQQYPHHQYPNQPFVNPYLYHLNPYQQYQSQYGSAYPHQQNSSYPQSVPPPNSGYAHAPPSPFSNEQSPPSSYFGAQPHPFTISGYSHLWSRYPYYSTQGQWYRPGTGNSYNALRLQRTNYAGRWPPPAQYPVDGEGPARRVEDANEDIPSLETINV